MKPRKTYSLNFSCQVLATELVELSEFERLQEETKNRIIDRVCSGWGLHNCTLVKKWVVHLFIFCTYCMKYILFAEIPRDTTYVK